VFCEIFVLVSLVVAIGWTGIFQLVNLDKPPTLFSSNTQQEKALIIVYIFFSLHAKLFSAKNLDHL